MFLYRLLSGVALAAYSPYALFRSLFGRRRLGDLRGRLGRGDLPDLAGGIWVHAVSVGEVGVAKTLISEVSSRDPESRIGLSVTTAAGWQVAGKARENGVRVFWFPLDLAGPVRRAFAAVRPGLILLTETELWPMLLDRAAAQRVPVALVNGRISERSFRRYRRLGSWMKGLLAKVSVYAMQSEQDARRIRSLGARTELVHVTGNVKYDLPLSPAFADSARLRAASAGRPVLVAGSTAEGEERAILEAWRPLADALFLAIAPRRPERFEEVAGLIEQQGFRAIRRSRPDDPPSPPLGSVYLLDSIGELASLYSEAWIAFVGGSLVPAGGHNPIEAWAQGVVALVGPHTENFREVVEAGEQGGYLSRVATQADLGRELSRILADPQGTAARGDRARREVAQNRGAAAATVDLVLPLLSRTPLPRGSRR